MDYLICTAGFLLVAFLSPFAKASKLGSNKKKICDASYALLVSLLIVTTFDVCPYTGRMLDGDSSVFIYIAKMMHRGYVPYRDLFDHKGPWLYFIEFCGLSGGTVFLWVLELIAAFVTICIALRIAEYFTENALVRYLSVFACFYVAGFYLYRGGNYTEFWSLPFICLSLLIFVKFFKQDEYSKLSIVLVGLTFGIVFLLRCNLISVWAVFMPAVVIKLIAKKRWKDILICAGLFIAGIILCIIPVVVYYGVNNAMGPMYEYYWNYNLFYTGTQASLDNKIGVFIHLAKYIWPGWIALLVALYKNRDLPLYAVNMLYLIVSIVLSVISGRAYENYFLNCLPCLIIPLTLTLNLLADITSEDSKKRKVPMVILLAVCMLASMVPSIIKNVTLDPVRLQRKNAVTDYMTANTSPDSDVYVLGGNGMYNIYSERYTKQKFFYQFPLTYNDELYSQFWQDMQKDPPDAIVVPSKWKEFDEMSDEERAVGVAAIRYDTDVFCSSNGYSLEKSEKFYVYTRS